MIDRGVHQPDRGRLVLDRPAPDVAAANAQNRNALAGAAQRRAKQRGRQTFRWISKPMLARVDLDDRDAVLAAMDEPGQ